MDPLPYGLFAPTPAVRSLGSGLAANANEQKVNSAGMRRLSLCDKYRDLLLEADSTDRGGWGGISAMAKFAFSNAPVKGALGLLFGSIGMLGAVFGESLVAFAGLVGCYVGVVLLSSAIRIEEASWYSHLWGRAGCIFRLAMLLLALTPIAVIGWLSRPQPYLVAYQICYSSVPALLPNGEIGVERYHFAVKFLNARENDPVWFEVTESNLTLGGRASKVARMGPPIKVTDKTFNALAVQAIDFDPPIGTPSELEGQYRFVARYGRNPEGPFDGKMEIGGPFTVSFAPNAEKAVLALGQYAGNDPRRIEKECEIKAKDDE